MSQFRPAVTSEAKPLIGLYSESGCGKTYSSLLLAKGFADDMATVGMIETESGRGEFFADDPLVGGYKVCPIRNDFSPRAYGAAITLAEKASLRVLIIDSASHEWEGAGGVLAMAAANQAGGKKGPLVWQAPKIDHAREFVLRLLQTPIPLVIVCMRAKRVMYQVTRDDAAEHARTHPDLAPLKVGDWARDDVVSPKQSEDILYEMMVHAWIDPAHNLHVTKWTKDAFKAIFLDGQPITVDTGRRLAEWAAGRAIVSTTQPSRGADGTRDSMIAEIIDSLSALSAEPEKLLAELSGFEAQHKQTKVLTRYELANFAALRQASDKWIGSTLGKVRERVEESLKDMGAAAADDIPEDELPDY